jgi:hypothetical protein
MADENAGHAPITAVANSSTWVTSGSQSPPINGATELISDVNGIALSFDETVPSLSMPERPPLANLDKHGRSPSGSECPTLANLIQTQQLGRTWTLAMIDRWYGIAALGPEGGAQCSVNCVGCISVSAVRP